MKQLGSLIFAFVAGAVIAAFLVMRFQPQPPPVDLKPYHDSIQKAEAERGRWMEIAFTHRLRADSLLKSLKSNKTKLHADIKVIEAFTADSRLRWNDSVMRAAGLR